MQLQIQRSLEAKLESICRESVDSTRSSLKETLRQLIRRMKRGYELAKQRQALSRLTDDQLKDIGISRADALAEADKPFWVE